MRGLIMSLLGLLLAGAVCAAVFCSSCGAKYEAVVKFCSKCGTAIIAPIGAAALAVPSLGGSPSTPVVKIRPEDALARKFLFDLKAGKPLAVAISSGSFGDGLAAGMMPFVTKLSMVREFEVTAKLLESGPPDGAKFQYHVRLYALSGSQDLRWYVYVLRVELLPDARVILFRDQTESGDAAKRAIRSLDFDPRMFDPTVPTETIPRPELETEAAIMAAREAARKSEINCDPKSWFHLTPQQLRQRKRDCR